MSKLFEGHVTIEPVFDADREKADQLAKLYGFKLADLLMQKKRSALPERSDKDTFMTGHSADFDSLKARMENLGRDLRAAGFSVWRYKIEEILWDVKFERVSQPRRTSGGDLCGNE